MSSATDRLLELFKGKGRQLRAAYRRAFQGSEGELMLDDLAGFCFLTKTGHVPGDPHASARHEGRRETLIFMLRKAGMTDDQIARVARQNVERMNAQNQGGSEA